MMRITSRQIPDIAAMLPPFPGVVPDLLETLNSELASIEALVRIARTDTVISAALLAAANGLCRLRAQPDISDLFAAASLIGMVRLRQIILNVGLNQFLGDVRGQAFVHRHSLGVAIVAQELAGLCDLPTGEAYVAGILHDIGQLAYLVTDAEGYQALRQQALAQGDLIARERERYGLDHAQIGLLLASHWKLPPRILQAINSHHDTGSAWRHKLQAVINLAETLAQALDLPYSPHNRVLTVNTAALDFLGLRWDMPEMQDLFERCRARFAIADA